MGVSRRQFIIGTAAGLILPSYYDKVLACWENHGEALLEIPESSTIELFAVDLGDGELEIVLGDPYEEPPQMTVREFTDRYFGGAECYFGIREEDLDVDLDAEMSRFDVLDSWARVDSPNAKAYRLLEDLDLGPDLVGKNAAGEIRFIDGPCPGNDYLGVQASTLVDISLLQKRLNDLQTGIRISVV